MVKSDKTVNRKSRRKRERERQKKSASSEEERPRTATLKRPFILDETLKDKVDMSLTKKEFMAAVKLCSDVAVQRGLPNMRLRAAKNFHSKSSASPKSGATVTPQLSAHGTSGNLFKFATRRKSIENVVGKPTESSKSDASSSGASPYLVSSKIKKKFPPDTSKIRPVTSKLDRPSNSSLDLPHIHIPALQLQQQRQYQSQPPPHLITSKLSRQLKLRGRSRRSSSITSLHESMSKGNNNNNNDDELMKKAISRPATTTSRVLQARKSARVELSKPEKVPEPCRSCGRTDLPERFHTHGPGSEPTSKIPIRLDASPKKSENKKVERKTSESPDSTSKTVEIVDLSASRALLSPKKNAGPPKPWISPKMIRKEPRQRSLSVDHSSQPKIGLKPLTRQKRIDGKADSDVQLVEDDGEMSIGSTSDSEVVVLVNQSRHKNKSKNDRPSNLPKDAKSNHHKSSSQEEEEMSIDDSDPPSSSTESSNTKSIQDNKSKKENKSDHVKSDDHGKHTEHGRSSDHGKHVEHGKGTETKTKPHESKSKTEPKPKTEKESAQKSDSNHKTESSPKPESNSKTEQSPKPDSDNSGPSEPNTPVGRAMTVDCSICGKPFGRNSIQFHVKQCQKKQQAKKDKLEQDQLEEKRQSSYIIEDDVAILPLKEGFETIWEAHMQLLVPCKLCARKFFPDRIEVHERSCKGLPNNKGKPVVQNNNNNNNQTNNNNNNNTIANPAIAMASVEMLLSTPMTIRRQLHSQTDAVVVHSSLPLIPDENDKSQSD